jgi:hypothetical protein
MAAFEINDVMPIITPCMNSINTPVAATAFSNQAPSPRGILPPAQSYKPKHWRGVPSNNG